MDPNEMLRALPLIAILRGIEPDEVEALGAVLYAAGFRCIEVPLNSPEPLKSISTLAASLPDDVLVGGGTVLDASQVHGVYGAGGRLIVSPDTHAAVISRTIDAGMAALPGVATASEALAASRCGAVNLKLFPAISYGPRHLKALTAVLPSSCRIIPVGGVTPEALGDWMSAGAIGCGAGSELYRPGDSPESVAVKAAAFVKVYREMEGSAGVCGEVLSGIDEAGS